MPRQALAPAIRGQDRPWARAVNSNAASTWSISALGRGEQGQGRQQLVVVDIAAGRTPHGVQEEIHR